MEEAEERYLSMLDNDIQKIIFLDWWNCGNLWNGMDQTTGEHILAKRYKHVKKDFERAGQVILTACSEGLG